MRWLLILALAFSMAACGSSGDGDDADAPTATTAGQAAQPTEPAAADAPTATTEAAEPTATTAPPPPTATLEPTATIPAPTSTPAPTATPDAGAADVIAGKWILDDNGFGSVYFIGEAVNQGTAMAMSVEVIVTLRDAANTILASEKAYVSGFVPAGELRPFKGIFINVDSSLIAAQEIATQFETFDPDSFYADLYTIDFEFPQSQWTAERLTGEVLNIGETAAEFVGITAIGYDANGEVVAVESTYTTLDVLQPGASSPFDTSFFGQDEAPASYLIFADGHRAD